MKCWLFPGLVLETRKIRPMSSRGKMSLFVKLRREWLVLSVERSSPRDVRPFYNHQKKIVSKCWHSAES